MTPVQLPHMLMTSTFWFRLKTSRMSHVLRLAITFNEGSDENLRYPKTLTAAYKGFR